MRKILALFSDTHGGSQLGLCSPHAKLERNGGIETVNLNEVQEWLWDIYKRGISTAVEMAGDDEIVPVHNGDLTHGTRFIEELMSTRVADQIDIGYFNLMPWAPLEQVKRFELIYGTGVHEFAEGSSTSIVSRIFQEAGDVEVGASYHLLADVAGVCVDIAHHGPHPGSRTWLKGNVARYYLRDRMIESLMEQKDPPQLFVRSHFHSFIHEIVTVGHHESRLIITPALSIPGEHARKATRSIGVVHCGMVLVECVNGNIGQVVPVMDCIDLRVRKTL